MTGGNGFLPCSSNQPLTSVIPKQFTLAGINLALMANARTTGAEPATKGEKIEIAHRHAQNPKMRQTPAATITPAGARLLQRRHVTAK